VTEVSRQKLSTAVVQTIGMMTLGDNICHDISTGMFVFEQGFIGKSRNTFKDLSLGDLATPSGENYDYIHSRSPFLLLSQHSVSSSTACLAS
jgi:hypothetical protein